jgi:hypothetical protein
VLRQVHESLWCHDAPVPLPLGMQIPARMTVARLADGLWMHSPLGLDDALVAEIEALGQVRHLVAPNLYHHLYLDGATARFPAARVYAPARLRTKRPDLRVDVELEQIDASSTPWPELVTLPIRGVPVLDEFVFIHQPSATLLVSDLVFNLHEVEGLLFPLVLRMFGTWRRLAQSKVLRRETKDRAAAAASVEALLGHPVRRLIPAHGDIVEGPQLADQLAHALTWMRGPKL